MHVNAITAIIAITRMRLIGTRLDANVRRGERCRTKARHAAQQSARLHPYTQREHNATVTRRRYWSSHNDRLVFQAHFCSNVIILCLVSGLIEISTVERGVVSLYGVKSELFVAMNSRGRLYGTVGMHSGPVSIIVLQC